MIIRLLTEAWTVWTEMAPYLLFGFGAAGVLSVWLSGAWVQRHLGGGGWRAAMRAALLGIPLPLCSCSVIPIAASLRRQGASRGATASFLMSTPQVGINSLIVSWGLMGPVITIARTVAAFISGLLCGTLVDATEHKPSSALGVGATENCPKCAGGGTDAAPRAPVWQRMLRHAFVTLPRDIAWPLLIGVTISALFTAFLPPDFFADRIAPGLPAMLLMVVIGIPVYVCSTSSIPVALALIYAGIQPGAALVFLITGPATNAATLTTLFRLLGARATAIYLAVLVFTALAVGWALDAWLLVRLPDMAPHCHMEGAVSWWRHAAGILLLIILLVPLATTLFQRGARRPEAIQVSPP